MKKKNKRNWVNELNLLFSRSWSDDGFQLSQKRAPTKRTNKGVFNSILKEFRKGFSEDIFIEIFQQTNKILLL